MSAYENLKKYLASSPGIWLVTGVAGFIGSNLLQALLELGQKVRGLDNFATGKKENLDDVKGVMPIAQWGRFEFLEGDIRNIKTCRRACEGIDYVLHQAALGSVPRSIVDPLTSSEVNVNGTLNLLMAAKDLKVKRFVYASSSSVYGDHPGLPKVESEIGRPLSPYAGTKLVNEIYANICARCYGLETVGLRYFNVFGPRQNPDGPYAAVIPKWIAALLKDEPIYINGDGTTSRDFCYVANAVQANLLAATTMNPEAVNQVYNVALNERTTLNELFNLLKELLGANSACPPSPSLANRAPIYRSFRPGDVMHSHADISLARKILGYQPTHRLQDGLREALGWYCKNIGGGSSRRTLFPDGP